jgi:hypothetical protein
MRLEHTHAKVLVTWDGQKMMEIVIMSPEGNILLVQTQGTGSCSTNIHQNDGWERVIL